MIFFSLLPVENRKRLQTLQNKGLRCALNKGVETSSKDLHMEANLAKLHYRQKKHTLNFMYNAAQVPSNLQSRSKLAVKTRSSTKVLLRIKRPNTERFKKRLAYI